VEVEAMSDGTDIRLPASIKAAWGLRERPHKGPKPGLNLERIVAAAIKIALTDGLAAVTMSRVATDLGTSAMSLYRYIAAKDELLLLMMDAAIGQPSATPTPDEGWRAGLSRWAWSYLAVLRQHPWALRVPISAPPITPNQIAWMEDALVSMRGTGLREAEKLSVLLLLSGYVRNVATLIADLASGSLASGSTVEEMIPAWSQLVTRLAAADRFPELRAALAAGVFDQADDPEDEFVFGLERILDGVDALVRARAPG
jgi:AcrR family transcriptional regulator